MSQGCHLGLVSVFMMSPWGHDMSVLVIATKEAMAHIFRIVIRDRAL